MTGFPIRPGSTDLPDPSAAERCAPASPSGTSQTEGQGRSGKAPSERTSPWAVMSRFEIPNLDDPDETYLTRWRIVQTPWFSIYLHRMDGPDSRPTLHDHPWSFVSFVLRGGYRERRLDPVSREVATRRVRWLNVIRRDDAHAIVSLDRLPTWTFVLTGARRRTWGYWELSPFGVNAEWIWTEFNQHPHDLLFQAALQHRRAENIGHAGAHDPTRDGSGIRSAPLSQTKDVKT